MLESQKAIARKSLLFGSFPDDVCDSVLGKSVLRHLPRGAAVFNHGEEAHSIFVVLDGWVKLYRVTRNGAEAIVGLFTKGESFGEAVALQHAAYPVTAEAVTDLDLVQVQAVHLIDLMRTRPEVSMAILSSTFVHLRSLVSQIEQLKAHSGAQRVAQFLLSLAPEEAQSCTVTLPYDKVLIAGRIGMKPESLSRAFQRLKSHGVTIKNNHAEISDLEDLRAFAEEEQGARAPTKF